MTGIELEALRRLLFFSRPEAAALVGEASERAWNLWESGQRQVPADVADRMVQLVEWRAQALQTARAAIQDAQAAHGEPIGIALVWYSRVEDWMSLAGREPWLWRPHCSVMAELVATEPLADLAAFDGPAYAHWLAGRPDDEQMRSAWAAQSS
jgi:hypothetical protein